MEVLRFRGNSRESKIKNKKNKKKRDDVMEKVKDVTGEKENTGIDF